MVATARARAIASSMVVDGTGSARTAVVRAWSRPRTPPFLCVPFAIRPRPGPIGRVESGHRLPDPLPESAWLGHVRDRGVEQQPVWAIDHGASQQHAELRGPFSGFHPLSGGVWVSDSGTIATSDSSQATTRDAAQR